nr:MAG TPA: hypothetical protein [Caudoviricetes sp.]
MQWGYCYLSVAACVVPNGGSNLVIVNLGADSRAVLIDLVDLGSRPTIAGVFNTEDRKQEAYNQDTKLNTLIRSKRLSANPREQGGYEADSGGDGIRISAEPALLLDFRVQEVSKEINLAEFGESHLGSFLLLQFFNALIQRLQEAGHAENHLESLVSVRISVQKSVERCHINRRAGNAGAVAAIQTVEIHFSLLFLAPEWGVVNVLVDTCAEIVHVDSARVPLPLGRARILLVSQESIGGSSLAEEPENRSAAAVVGV